MQKHLGEIVGFALLTIWKVSDILNGVYAGGVGGVVRSVDDEAVSEAFDKQYCAIAFIDGCSYKSIKPLESFSDRVFSPILTW